MRRKQNFANPTFVAKNSIPLSQKSEGNELKELGNGSLKHYYSDGYWREICGEGQYHFTARVGHDLGLGLLY